MDKTCTTRLLFHGEIWILFQDKQTKTWWQSFYCCMEKFRELLVICWLGKKKQIPDIQKKKKILFQSDKNKIYRLWAELRYNGLLHLPVLTHPSLLCIFLNKKYYSIPLLSWSVVEFQNNEHHSIRKQVDLCLKLGRNLNWMSVLIRLSIRKFRMEVVSQLPGEH